MFTTVVAILCLATMPSVCMDENLAYAFLAPTLALGMGWIITLFI